MTDRIWTYRGRIAKVIDGKTLRMELDLGFNHSACVYIHIRDLDAPEVQGPNKVEGFAWTEAAEQWVAWADHRAIDPEWPFEVRTYKGRSFNHWVGDVRYRVITGGVPLLEDDFATYMKSWNYNRLKEVQA